MNSCLLQLQLSVQSTRLLKNSSNRSWPLVLVTPPKDVSLNNLSDYLLFESLIL